MGEVKTLYRKYRPKSFAEVVGQRHIADILNVAIKNSDYTHAYLFTGPHGVGKTTVARILAHNIIGEDYTSDDSPLDIVEIDAASNRRIDEIRDLREKVNLAPIKGKAKVYIIDEVHMLTKEAFNALLKTLEEPPSHVYFILATTDFSALPATIVSRTQRYTFNNVDSGTMIAHLKDIASKEKIKIDDKALGLLAEQSLGSMRDAMSLLGQVMQLPQPIDQKTVSVSLGISSSEEIHKICDAIESKDSNSAIELARILINNGSSAGEIANALIRAQLKSSAVNSSLLDDLLKVSESDHEQLRLEVAIAKSCCSKSVALETDLNDKKKVSTPKPPDSSPVEKDDKPILVQTAKNSKETAKSETWDNFVQSFKDNDKSVFTLLRMVDHQLEDNTLTIRCKFDLHYNKIIETKVKKEITKKAIEIFNVNNIEFIKSSDVKIRSTDKNDAAKDIMGGGEVVMLGANV